MATLLCAAVASLGLTFIVAPITMSGLVLSAAGFGKLGVVAGKCYTPYMETQYSTDNAQGTPAAIIHGWIGNVAAGSAFVLAQRARASCATMTAIATRMQVGPLQSSRLFLPSLPTAPPRRTL